MSSKPPLDEERKQAALDLLPKLKDKLGDETSCTVDDAQLLKFLHWKQDVDRAAQRFTELRSWRTKNPWAFDATPLMASKDSELKRVLESQVLVAPEGMVDKHGHPVMVGRLRNNDMGDGRTAQDVCRMIMYTIDRVLEREEAQVRGIVVFHDLRGLSRKNMDPAIPRTVISAVLGHFPIRINGIYILDAPWFFKVLFKTISLMMPAKLRQRTMFVNDINEVPIDREMHLEEHGGKTKHDQTEWVKSQMVRENDGSAASLADGFNLEIKE